MLNFNWVCFDCRTAVRHHPRAVTVKCPLCAQPCENLGDNIPIPARTKVKLWHNLREKHYRWKRECNLYREKEKVRSIHSLEKKMDEIRNCLDSKVKEQTLERYREALDKIKIRRVYF
jgi:hypothetical protein